MAALCLVASCSPSKEISRRIHLQEELSLLKNHDHEEEPEENGVIVMASMLLLWMLILYGQRALDL